MNKQYLRKLLVIAIPIMLNNVISQLQMIIDRIFLGRLNSLYMSALGNVTSPVWTTMSFCFTIATGASILISQAVGTGEKDNVKEYASSMMKWNNVLPCLLFIFWMFFSKPVFRLMGVSDNVMPFCLGYIRYYAPMFLIMGLESSFCVIMQTSNYTKPLVMYGVIRSGLNILLDWILIFGKFGFPAMGIEGAALATTIAEYAGFLYALYVVSTNKALVTMPDKTAVLAAPFKPFLHSISLGINVALEDFAWNFGNLVIIRILNSINEMAAGIYSIVFSVEVLIVVIIGAIGNGTMTISGEAKGMNNKKMYKGVCRIAYILSAGVSFVTLIICAIIPEQILGLFTKDQSIVTSCGIYLLIVCFNLFGKSGNIIFGNSIRGYGDTMWMFITQIFGTFMVIGFALLFVFVFKLGIIGVFIAVIMDEGIRAIVNLLKLISITKEWEGAKHETCN